MTRPLIRYAVSAALAVPGVQISGQDAPLHRLAGTPITAAISFTDVTAIRELSDARVLVSDRRDKLVHLLSGSLQQVAEVGRRGEGPGEFASPWGLFAARGDTTWLHDDEGQRLLTILPDGRIVPAHGAPPGGPAARSVLTEPQNLRYDRSGRWCIPLSLPRTSTADSTELMCGGPGAAAGHTTHRLLVPPRRPLNLGQAGAPIPINVRFAAADGWTMNESGELAIIRSTPYRVEWRSGSGAPMRGATVPWSPIPVTDAERGRIAAEFRERQRNAPQSGLGIRGARRDTLDPNAMLARAELPIATSKGPFDPGGIISGPGRELWVLRYGRDGEPPRYDVFDGRGLRVRQVEIASGSRIVAVTIRGVYIVRTDDDGLQHLERWSRPS